MIVAGDRIAWAGVRGARSLPGGIEIVDGRGKYAIPGLIEAHHHLGGTTPAERAANLQRLLTFGYTTVFEPAVSLANLSALKASAEPPEAPYPRYRRHLHPAATYDALRSPEAIGQVEFLVDPAVVRGHLPTLRANALSVNGSGATVAFGSDGGTFGQAVGISSQLELVLHGEAGLSPDQVIRDARRGTDAGAAAPGRLADAGQARRPRGALGRPARGPEQPSLRSFSCQSR